MKAAMTLRRLLLLAAVSTTALSAALPALAQASLTAAPAAATAQSQARPVDPWAHEASDLKPDSNVRFGILPNGMRYALLKNATPPNQASFRLRIDAGSLMENENQLGLAHFMEHMAFNGTTNIPENELLRILERLGLAFGADTNAFTSFDQTAYILELPRTNDETVDASLRIMREQVSEALMEADDIDAERGVIEGEERTRNTPGLRSTKAQLALLAQGQRLASRLPIGDLNVIRNAPRERFVEFYEGYYRPERATFIAVGDFDVDAMERKVRDAFQSWRGKGQPAPEPDLGKVAPRQPETRILVEPGIQSSIQINWVREPDLDKDTAAERRDDLVKSLGAAVLNRRLGEIARGDNPPFISASGGDSTLFKSLDIGSVSASFNPGGWKRALETIEQEQRRLVQYGVTDAELQREITDRRTALENAVAAAATRTTPGLAGALLSAVNDDRVFTHPQTNLELFNANVANLTASEVNARMKSVFEGQGPVVLLITPVEIAEGEASVTAALEASRRTPVAAPAAEQAMQWPYESFGQPGQVRDRQELAEVGATVVRFANGVSLTVKPTTFRDEQILVSVRTGNGELGLPAGRISPAAMAPNVFTAGGLGKLTADQMNKALTGRIYSAGLSLEGDAWRLSGATRPADLQLQMQILAAYLTDPGLRPQPFAQLKNFYPQLLTQMGSTPAGAYQRDGSALLASGDAREALPKAEEIAAWTIDDIKAGVTQGLGAGPISIVMVGDVTVEDAIKTVASTFGALPARGQAPVALPGSDVRRFPAPAEAPVRLTHTGPAEQAMALVAWPTTDQVGDRTEARTANILSEVLSLRVLEEIREKQALTYSPNTGASSSDVFDDYGLISVSAQLTPQNRQKFYDAVDQIVAGLRDAPPSQDELDRARRPVIERLRQSQAGNDYWLGQLEDVAADPAQVQQTLTHISDIEALTPADIQRAAQRYLVGSRAFRIEVLSDKAPAQ